MVKEETFEGGETKKEMLGRSFLSVRRGAYRIKTRAVRLGKGKKGKGVLHAQADRKVLLLDRCVGEKKVEALRSMMT